MAERRNPTMGAIEWALLIALAILWGGSFFFGKVAVGELPPLVLVALRVLIAAATLNLVVRLAGHAMPWEAVAWRRFLAMGLLNNLIPFSLIFWAQTRIDSGLASILNATTPLFGVVLAHLFTQEERLTPMRLAGVLLGLGGVAVLLGPALSGGLAGDGMAELACLAGALAYGFAGVYGRLRLRAYPPLVTACGQLTASTAVMVPLVLALDPSALALRPDWTVIGAVLALALISTALAYVIYFRILASAGSTNILLVTVLNPVSAILLGALVLGERLELRHFAGMAVIAAGLAAIDGRPFAWLRKVASRA